jgi:hypothetical protein
MKKRKAEMEQVKSKLQVDTETLKSGNRPLSSQANVFDYQTGEESVSSEEDDKVRNWIQNVEVGSTISRYTSGEQGAHPKPQAIQTKPHGRKDSVQDTPSPILRNRRRRRNDDDNVSMKSRAKSIISGTSERSLTKSMKSVLFNIAGAEEVRSEQSSDDIANINQAGSDGIGRTCDKFTIHGPYVDDELNVYHELCSEYQKAAEATFARRSMFSRTKPAHERVYGFIGSDRRSKWVNRNEWTSATNDYKLLDHLFRSTIRSRSQRIKSPGLELEHFKKDRRLDMTRFRQIMKGAFNRRDALLHSIVGKSNPFDRIS